MTGTQGFVKGYKWQKYTLKEDKSATCNKVIPSFVSLHSEAETQHVVCDSPCLTLLLRILREYDVLFFAQISHSLHFPTFTEKYCLHSLHLGVSLFFLPHGRVVLAGFFFPGFLNYT